MARANRPVTFLPRWAYTLITLAAFLSVIFFTYILIIQNKQASQQSFFFLLIIYALSVALLFFGITEVIAQLKGEMLGFTIKAGGPFAGFLIILLFGIYYNQKINESLVARVQLYGPGGLADVPVKNVANAITLIPANGDEVTGDVDSKGRVSFHVNPRVFEDSVRFQLQLNAFMLSDSARNYKLVQGRELDLPIRWKKARYVFHLTDIHGEPLTKLRMLSSELKLDRVSDDFGTIYCDADTAGVQLYHFSFPDSHYRCTSLPQSPVGQTEQNITLETVK